MGAHRRGGNTNSDARHMGSTAVRVHTRTGVNTAQNRSRAGYVNRAQDEHLTEEQRQGRWEGECLHTTRGQSILRQYVEIDTEARHPERDIHPPGKYTIQIGQHNRRTGDPHLPFYDPEAPAPTDLQSLACAFVYDPRGKCLGMTTSARLRDLWLRYVKAKSVDPTVHAQSISGARRLPRRRS
jgi:hypothetical protein